MNAIKKLILTILPICVLNINSQTQKDSINSYVLVEQNSLLVENFNGDKLSDENIYNYDNKIFKVGNLFTYKYKHINPQGQIKLFRMTTSEEWEFTSQNDSLAIKQVIFEVANGNPMAKYVPNYNQTNILYKLDGSDTVSISGAVENRGNIWVHPPRDFYFSILELNPFPYIKRPFQVNQKWSWSLDIGDQWQDERWKTWKGQITNNYTYEVVKETIIDTDLGKLDCYVIESFAESRIGKTKLVAYFNDTYGFLKLDYTNIDDSKTILELIKFDNKNK